MTARTEHKYGELLNFWQNPHPDMAAFQKDWQQEQKSADHLTMLAISDYG